MYDNSATILAGHNAATVLAVGMGAAALGRHRLASGPGEARIAEHGGMGPGAFGHLAFTFDVVTLFSVGLLLVVLGIALMLAKRRTGADHRAS